MDTIVINEAFKVSRTDTAKGQPIAFIDPNLPENAKTFEHKDILKKYGAKWSKSPKFKYTFPAHSRGFWFWYIGDTQDKWNNVYKKMIEPALREIHQLEGVSEEESQESILAGLEGLIGKIKTSDPVFDGEVVLSKDDKEKILDKLEGFKKTLTNIHDDDEFKETIRKLVAWKSAQGHEFSLLNTILVLVQKPDAKIVKSKTTWAKYNRTINKDAKPIFLWKPASEYVKPYSSDEKKMIIGSFLKSVGKAKVSDLTAGEKERLAVMTSGKFMGGRFELYDAYDVSGTSLIEGQEDLIKPLLDGLEGDNAIKWFEGDEFSEEVKPVYSALMKFADEKGINVELVPPEQLRGARGRSSSGKIQIIQNEGNDVGLTKTLAHEISHEILHQTYLKNKDGEMKQYFVGTAEGRGMVEQQAELTAWMVLAAFGFDLQTTSLNYVALWGGRADSMVKVFDYVAKTANYMIDYIAKNGAQLSEETVDVPTGKKHYTGADVAQMLGVSGEYQQELRKEHEMNEHKKQMLEKFKKLIK